VPALVALTVVDDPDRWRDLGFSVAADGTCQVGAVRFELVPPGEGEEPAVVAWAFDGLAGDPLGIDGIPTTVAEPAAGGPAGHHPNGATSLDHVVVTTPDVDRTVTALEAAGLRALRERPTEAGGRPMRQVFFRPGEAVVELVGPSGSHSAGRAKFYGLAFTVADLDAAAARLGDAVGRIKAAVQPGRRIATVRAAGGPGVPIALMSGEPEG
jgi:hypothetical protein